MAPATDPVPLVALLRCALVAVVVLAATGVAQVPPEVTAPFGEQVDVEVVSVDVLVTDRDGVRVTGLGRDDFELLVDGRPVAIEYFSAPPAMPLPGAPAPAVPAPGLEPRAVETLPPAAPAGPPPAVLVVFVDQSALEPRVRQNTVAELREFARQRAPDERVMLVAFEEHLHLLVAPTGIDAEVEAAFERLEALPSNASMVSAERRRLEHQVRAFGRSRPLVRSEVDPEANAQAVQRTQEIEAARLQAEIELWTEQEIDRQRRAVRAASDVVGALAALPGRKTAVFATAGFSAEPGRYLLAFLAQKRERDAALSSISKSALLGELGVRLAAEFEELVRDAQNGRVAFYTVAPPAAAPANQTAEFGSAGRDQPQPPPRDFAPVEADSSVRRLALATGGRVFALDDRLDARLAEVRDDVRSAYSLGFATGPEAGREDHRIEVRARSEGLVLRHRESYRRRSTAERQQEALLAAVTLGEASNGFGLELEVGASAREGRRADTARVPLAVRIPIGALTLVSAGPQLQGRLFVRLAVRNAAGRVVVEDGAGVDIAIPAADAERALDSVWVHRVETRLPPGRHRVAVLVVDEGAGGFATVVAPVEVAGQ